MDYKDYYKTLHITKEASQEDIKRAYRRLARKYHPDINKDANAEARFKEINEANEVFAPAAGWRVTQSHPSPWKVVYDHLGKYNLSCTAIDDSPLDPLLAHNAFISI